MARLPAFLGGEPAVQPILLPHNEAIRLALLAAWQDHSWRAYDSGKVEEVESRLRGIFQGQHSLTCASGTLAVEVALKSLGVEAGQLVAMAAYDYPGNFLTLHALGLKPFLIDLDKDTFQLSLAGLEAAIRAGAKVVIASHLHGGLVPMRELIALCQQNKVVVIEDACQCPGAIVQGKPAGSWGDCGVISFGGSKLLTAGRGGALLTNNPRLAQHARVLLTRGSKVAALSELQAVVLLPQFDSLNQENLQREVGTAFLRERLQKIPGLSFLCPLPEKSSPAYYKLGIRLNGDAFGLTREQFLLAAKAEGIPIEAGFAALHIGRAPSRWQSAAPLHQAALAHEQLLVLHHSILLQPSALEKVALAIDSLYTHADEIAVEFRQRQ